MQGDTIRESWVRATGLARNGEPIKIADRLSPGASKQFFTVTGQSQYGRITKKVGCLFAIRILLIQGNNDLLAAGRIQLNNFFNRIV